MFENLCLFYDIYYSLYSVLDESKRKKKANYSIHNVLKSKFYHKQEYHTCELQYFVLHVCCKNVCILMQTSQINQYNGFIFSFSLRGVVYICINWVNYFLHYHSLKP